MTPQAFAADLATIPAMDDLTVRICSGGGDVWAAQAIGAMLENRLGTVTAQIEGICASAATIVASHCKVVKAAEDATYMIHPIKVNPNGFVDMEGLKQLMDALTVMRTNVLNQYTGCVELLLRDGRKISINCTGVEDALDVTMAQRSELDYLIYNDPLGYADLILNGDPEEYLKNVTGSCGLED